MTLADLIDYMRATIGPTTAALLEWDGDADYQFAAGETVARFGEEALTTSKLERALKAEARYQIWKRVSDETVIYHDVSTADSTTARLAQIHKQASEKAAEARQETDRYAVKINWWEVPA